MEVMNLKGINIQEEWAKKIYNGEKKIEARTWEGGLYVDGRLLWVIETPNKPRPAKRKFAEITGVIRFGQSIEYSSYEQWRSDFYRHCVPEGSKWDWYPEKLTGKSMKKQRMFAWPIVEVRQLSVAIPAPESRGNVGSLEHMAHVSFSQTGLNMLQQLAEAQVTGAGVVPLVTMDDLAAVLEGVDWKSKEVSLRKVRIALEKAKGYTPDTLADDLHMKQLCSLCSEFVNQHTRDESIGPLEQDIDGKSWDSDGTTLTWGFIPPEGLDDDTRGPDIEEPFAKTQEINGPVVETRVDEMFEDSSWESIFANILQGDQGEEIDVDEPIV